MISQIPSTYAAALSHDIIRLINFSLSSPLFLGFKEFQKHSFSSFLNSLHSATYCDSLYVATAAIYKYS
jgi:hypothetical protein